MKLSTCITKKKVRFGISGFTHHSGVQELLKALEKRYVPWPKSTLTSCSYAKSMAEEHTDINLPLSTTKTHVQIVMQYVKQNVWKLESMAKKFREKTNAGLNKAMITTNAKCTNRFASGIDNKMHNCVITCINRICCEEPH